MMNYKKGQNVEEEFVKENIPIANLPNNFLWMHVKGGTKVSNVIEFAKKAIDSNEHRNIVWTGSGGGTLKTISCAEIMKRDYPFHQVTKLCFRKVDEYWEPEGRGLEKIVATREIPCIHIFLTLDDIDSKTQGYQFSKTNTTFWLRNSVLPKPKQNKSNNNKRDIQQSPDNQKQSQL